MFDFQFLQNQITKKWVVLAPRRAKRPDEAKGTAITCPFCIGNEDPKEEVYRVSSPADTSDWLVRVVKNKYPFAPIHEVIIHSPDHHKNFDELPLDQGKRILETFRYRYNEHAHKGQVYIFHNRGEMAGESLPHPHSQLAVVPFEVQLDIPTLDSVLPNPLILDTEYLILTCPQASAWPDEVWIAQKKRGRVFGQISDEELTDLAKALSRLIQIFDLRHGHEFPFNFYIYPREDWYVRIIPRLKTLGGFELGTNVYVNTQDPKETIAFIKEHFVEPDVEKIKKVQKAEYKKAV